ncbi:hypothetical protein SFA35_09975 [Pseudomonas sp. HR96]|uniref:hypothetical protein n=1 Tax=Pseudomonas sp. HR96 TaxID=1027966 RepID=UPI002A75217A|nr:hypothetical protein [Pseudomonas sp. HR96]WPP01645.1 hypothetical protein SFA35_09975 [Pseudomonas sp. HR96]
MAIRLNEDEKVAWDTYFSAALATAKSNGLPTTKGLDNQWEEAVELAARIADKMVIERRLRIEAIELR